MKRDHFEAAVEEEIDKILNLVADQDAELFEFEQNAEAYRKHLVAIGGRYCDVCHGSGNGEAPPQPEDYSITYAFELHMRDAHNAQFTPGPDPKDLYTAEDWKLLASVLASSHWKVVEIPQRILDQNPHAKAHLNDGRGGSFGDVIDDEDNVCLSMEKQVEMFKEITEWRRHPRLYTPPM